MGLRWVLLLWATLLTVGEENFTDDAVTYDRRSLIIHGKRKILFSGSIHYPRSTPEMWPSLIAKAKEGGLDVIQTYVFWNAHEASKGQYNFNGRLDLVKFLKEIQAQGMYACLRVGPFIEGEWGYGGLPFWLHDIPGIVFRTDNEPFKFHMQKFTTKIVNLMKKERLYAPQGGPIILSQIENEYQSIEGAFRGKGSSYVKWAGNMAVGLQTGVPWIMCKQNDAPDPVINSCNGLSCGETFEGPNSPNKPLLWTENWTQLYQVFGEDLHDRSVKDIAFAVALFVAKNGSYVNYYMYHGGTNFGRSGSSYVTTSYYDNAPLDEYGFAREPKWGHLKELHETIKLISETLLSGQPTYLSLGKMQQAYIFQKVSGACAAFLSNFDSGKKIDVQFRQRTYELPRRSISIMPDCKEVIYNTAKINAQHSLRSVQILKRLDNLGIWQEFREDVPSFEVASFTANTLLEQMNVTKDESDYLWYTLRYMHKATCTDYILHAKSRSHVLHAYVNGVFLGSAQGRHDIQSFVLDKPVSMMDGTNQISLLSIMVGLPDSGAYMERKVAGLREVRIQNSACDSVDFAEHQWGYQVGMPGETLKIYKKEGLKNVPWTKCSRESNVKPLTWYKTEFSIPTSSEPIALDLSSMSKGEAWINGKSIGRYWVSFHTSTGIPSQTLYHVPQSFLKHKENLLVLFEENGGDPTQITVSSISIARVCAHVNFKSSLISFSNNTTNVSLQRVHLRCPPGRKISSIEFASFGTPAGSCSSYSAGRCHSVTSKAVMEKACMWKSICSVLLSAKTFGDDPCPGTPKALLVDAACA